jgi:hypothetical protein
MHPQPLSDEELIAQARAASAFSPPHHEMEKQRRLEAVIQGAH